MDRAMGFSRGRMSDGPGRNSVGVELGGWNPSGRWETFPRGPTRRRSARPNFVCVQRVTALAVPTTLATP